MESLAGPFRRPRARGGPADDGPGIPPDEREDVFDNGYTTREDGTGFDLAIGAAVAGAHEWSVEITEGCDGGARFEFTDCRFVDPGRSNALGARRRRTRSPAPKPGP